MPGLSSTCRCGPRGAAKHEMGKCPHLFHVCTERCGSDYKKYAQSGFAAGSATRGSVPTPPTPPVTRDPVRIPQNSPNRIVPPWER